MRTRFLIPAVALLAMLAAAIPAFAQEEADDDAPPPSHSAELRVWQSIADPLDGLWVSARADEDARWTTTALNIAMREGGGWRIANLTVDALDGELDVRVWQDPSDLRELWLSARPAGGSWEEHGTKRLDLDARSRSGRYRYDDLAVALEWPDAEPPAPGESRDALCIPEGLERERLFTRVWRSVATPHRYWISARPDADARWSTRAVSLAESGVDGWNAGGLTFDAGEADFELRLWVGDGGLYLSTRVAGTTWHEDGTRRLNLTRTSTSGRYPYANRTVRLTLPEAEPPDPGTSVRDWDCPETGTGGGTRTGDGDGGTGEGGGPGAPGSGGNTAPTANAGADRHVAPGAASIQLDGSGSSDPDGDTLTYSWAQTGGATVKNLTGTDTASPSFEFPDGASVGDTFTFTLTVDDGNDESDTDDVTITVNTPPQVDEITIDIDISVNASAQAADTVTAMANTPSVNCDAANVHCANRGATVTLTATVTDPDGTMTYQWAHTGGTYAGSTISLSGNATLTASFTMPMDANQGDTVVVTFTATDSLGATGTATATITARNRAPHADADDDQTASVGDTVTLDGSDSADPDGDTLTYSWAKTGGTYTGAVSLTGSTTASPSFDVDAALAGLTAIFTLTVDDGHGGSDTDTVTVTVNQQQGGGGSPPPGGGQQPGQRVNEPPTADAGDDRTFAADATVTLDGSDSKDDSAISTWEWALTGGTYTGSLQIADGETTSFYMPDAAGKTLIITLTVTDDEGETATDTVTITGAATALTLDAGSDASVQRGATHNLSGTYTDADSSSTPTYQWTKTGGTYTGSVAPITNDDQLTASFKVPLGAKLDQTIIMTLTVKDGGKTYTDTVKITADNHAPSVTSLTAASANVNRGSDASLTAVVSDSTTNETFTYSWVHDTSHTDNDYNTKITVTANAQDPKKASFTVPTDAGIDDDIVIKLTVTDGAGESDTDTVTITAKNAPLTNVSAGADRTVNRGTEVSLSGSATDPEGTTVTYAWTPANLLTDANTSTPDFQVPTSASIGQEYTFTMTVKDENGGTGANSQTDTVKITAANVAPTTTPSVNPATATAGDTITLFANAFDTENSTLTYTWSQTAGTTATLSSTTAASPTFNAPTPTSVPETLTFSVTVKDENGGTGYKSATGTVSVTVNNTPPTASAGADQSVNQNKTVTLGGSAGAIETGDSITYSWVHDADHEDDTYDGAEITITGTNTKDGAASFTSPNLSAADFTTDKNKLVFKLTVSDGRGGTATDTVTITVTNAEPTIKVTGGNRNVTDDTTYTLKATTTDDGTPTTTWSVTKLGTAPDTTIGTTTGTITIPKAAVVNDQYEVTATVTDEDGATASHKVTLTVNNQRPNAVISPSQACKGPGETVNFNHLASTDPDVQYGDPGLTASWAKTGGTYTGAISITSTITAASYTVPSDAESYDTIIVTLTVNDGKGGTDTDTFTTEVQTNKSLCTNLPPVVLPPADNNQPPTISFAKTDTTQPIGSIASGTLVKRKVWVEATVTDNDTASDQLQYLFSVQAGTYKNISNITFNHTAGETKGWFYWPDDSSVGQTVGVSLNVYDKTGQHSVSAGTYIWRENAAPELTTSGVSDHTYLLKRDSTTSLTWTAMASDPDGQGFTYKWLRPTLEPPPPNSPPNTDPTWQGDYQGPLTLTISGANKQTVAIPAPSCTGSNAIQHGETIVLRLDLKDTGKAVGSTLLTVTASSTQGNSAPTIGSVTVRMSSNTGLDLGGHALASDDKDSDANLKYKWLLHGVPSGIGLYEGSNDTTGATVSNIHNPTLKVGTIGADHTYTGGIELQVTDKNCAVATKKWDIVVQP